MGNGCWHDEHCASDMVPVRGDGAFRDFCITGDVVRITMNSPRTESDDFTATLEDAMAVEERPNMPATTAEWPNWSLALPQPIETLEKNPTAARIARTLDRRASRRKRKTQTRRRIRKS